MYSCPSPVALGAYRIRKKAHWLKSSIVCAELPASASCREQGIVCKDVRHPQSHGIGASAALAAHGRPGLAVGDKGVEAARDWIGRFETATESCVDASPSKPAHPSHEAHPPTTSLNTSPPHPLGDDASKPSALRQLAGRAAHDNAPRTRVSCISSHLFRVRRFEGTSDASRRCRTSWLKWRCVSGGCLCTDLTCTISCSLVLVSLQGSQSHCVSDAGDRARLTIDACILSRSIPQRLLLCHASQPSTHRR